MRGEALFEDLGREHDRRTNADVAKALDVLKMAAFGARVYDARRAETVIDTFGLLDRWRNGERHRRGRPAQAGYLFLFGLALRSAPGGTREPGRVHLDESSRASSDYSGTTLGASHGAHDC